MTQWDEPITVVLSLERFTELVQMMLGYEFGMALGVKPNDVRFRLIHQYGDGSGEAEISVVNSIDRIDVFAVALQGGVR